MNFKIPNFNTNIPKITFQSNDKNNFSKYQSHKKYQPNKLSQPQKDSFEMSIGYVNDIHGQTNNMLRILSGLKGDLKVSAGDNDIGDEKNTGVHRVTTRFLNVAGIRATALGNHELDTTQKDCIDSIKNYNGDFLSINYKKDPIEEQDADEIEKLGRAELDKHLKNSTIVEVKGEKIGIIGASPMDMLERLTHPAYYADSHMDSLEETIEEIQEEIDELKEQGVNKIVLLSHLGYKTDKLVAKEIDGIDVIIAGHTHELFKDIKEDINLFYSKTGEPIILTEAGRDGNYFGLLNLTFNKDGVITKAQNNIGETRFFKRNMINQHLFDEILGKPEVVGVVKQAPPPPLTLIEENPHVNFVCDVMREMTNSDIGLWHNCGARNFFHEGEINSRDVKDLSPFLDYVAVANVSEKTLVDMFKDAIYKTSKTPGYKPGLIAVSGLTYKVNIKKGELLGMTFIDKNGKKHEIDINNPSANKHYRIVTDEFLMSAGADFKVLCPEDKCLEKFNYDKDYLVCEYLKQKNEPLVIDHYGRIEFETND